MKLETLSEVKSAINPNGATKVYVDIPNDLIQRMADKHAHGDFEFALEHIAEMLGHSLVDVDEWFNY